ncbi:MAG: ABC transporter ATP-binding protein [Clostridia bacterium]|nr:ABC transporter ATP-binding protein [Clostridia bacterium]
MAIFEARNITQSYEGVPIIEDICLALNHGEVVCLIGASGVGKSTLFQVLSGMKKPDSGGVFLNGEDITGKTGMVSYMLQKDMLLPFMNVIDNVALPYRLKGFKKKEAREKVRSYFGQFGLEGAQDKLPDQLSGGMRQRAAFMRTYFFGREVVLLDEPFSALDELTKADLYEWYLNIGGELGLATLFISHSLEEAVSLSNRVYVMSGVPGRIEAEVAIKRRGSLREFCSTSEFSEYKNRLRDLL